MKFKFILLLFIIYIYNTCFCIKLQNSESNKLELLNTLIKQNQELTEKLLKRNIINNNQKTQFSYINQESTPCIIKEGMLKIRDKDVLEREVPVSYVILNNERLTYYINPKDETTIQGSILLKQIKGDIQKLKNFPTCFYIQTIDDSSECTICAENVEKANEWIKAITQNSVNCIN